MSAWKRGHLVPKPPNPYPPGDPCGIVGHMCWCRCAPPQRKDDRYGPGDEEYERVKARNEAYRRTAE